MKINSALKGTNSIFRLFWEWLVQYHDDEGLIVSGMDEGMQPVSVQNIASGDATAAVIHATLPKYVRLVCATANVYYLVSAAGTIAEATTGVLLPQGVVEKVYIPAGNKISVLGGTLNITTMG